MKMLHYQSFIFSLVVLLFVKIYAQVQFDTHIVTNNAAGAWSVYAIDMDDDQDIDILSASMEDDKIAWYENDGDQNFTPHVISDSAIGACYVFAADMDKDLDIDVVATYGDYFNLIGEIVWYENDGNQNFTCHYIVTNALWPGGGYAVDLDGDTDMDILFYELIGKKASWCENDGNQNFTLHLIAADSLMFTDIYSADVDGDSDLDILTTSVDDDLFIFKVEWHENDGNESFTSHLITSNALGASSVYAIDLDSDDDMDVLSTSNFDHKVAWYENDGTQYFTPHTITTNANAAWDVIAVDINSDSTIDILSASAGDNKVNWYENNGSQNYTTHNIASNALHVTQVFAKDIDGDTDIDVLAPSRYSNRVYWYENLLITGPEDDIQTHEIPQQCSVNQNYPNPFNPKTTIEYSISKQSNVKLEIFNLEGQTIKTLVNESKNPGIYSVVWDSRNDSGTKVNSGLYFYKLISNNYSISRKMLLLK